MPRQNYVVHEPTPDEGSKSLNYTSNLRDKQLLVRVKLGRILISLSINIDTDQEDFPYVSTVLLNTIRESEIYQTTCCESISLFYFSISEKRYSWMQKNLSKRHSLC